LELHTNLTVVQARLLEILQGQLGNFQEKEIHQRAVQRHWNEFTMSMEESFDSMSAGASNLMKELFMGLLRLQSFTTESAKYVADELKMLELDVQNVRGELRQVHGEIDSLGTAGISKIDQLAEMSQQRLFVARPYGPRPNIDTTHS
jgi:hypothetical protein